MYVRLTPLLLAALALLFPMISLAQTPRAQVPQSLYIVSFFKSALTVVDLSTHKVVKKIALSTNANGVAVTPDGKNAYVCYGDGDRVLAIDLMTEKIVPIFGNIGWNSAALLTAPWTGMLYLATSGGTPSTNKFLCIDPHQDAVTDEIVLGPYNFPLSFRGAVLDPTLPRAFAVDATANEIDVVDLKAKKVAERFPLPSGKSYAGFAISPDGQTLYAGSRGSNLGGLFCLDTKTFVPQPLGNTTGATSLPVISPDGKVVYAVLNETQVIGLQTADGKEVARWTVAGRVSALAVTPDGRTLFAVCSEGKEANSVLVLDTQLSKKVDTIDVDSPYALSIAPSPAGTPLR